MILQTIAAGLGIIASVSTIIRNINDPNCARQTRECPQRHKRNQSAELLELVNKVDKRIVALERQMAKYQQNPQDIDQLLKNYNKLIHILQNNKIYSDRLYFIPTTYGIWKLVKLKKKFKKTILRDPEGEYIFRVLKS